MRGMFISFMLGAVIFWTAGWLKGFEHGHSSITYVQTEDGGAIRFESEPPARAPEPPVPPEPDPVGDAVRACHDMCAPLAAQSVRIPSWVNGWGVSKGEQIVCECDKTQEPVQ